MSSLASVGSSLCKTRTGCALKSPRLARVFPLPFLLIGVTPRAQCPERLTYEISEAEDSRATFPPCSRQAQTPSASEGPRRRSRRGRGVWARPGLRGGERRSEDTRATRGRRARPPRGSRRAAAEREPRRAQRAVGTRALPGSQPTPRSRLPSAHPGPPRIYR